MTQKQEAVAPAAGLASAADYLSLTKPRVILMILIVTAVGFLLGTPGPVGAFDPWLLLSTLAGTALVAGGTLALNQYLEIDLDARMKRTMRRPLPGGRMTPVEALAFGSTLACAGLLCLTFAVNPTAALVTATTLVTYLFAYTPLKRRTAACTVVGAFPGALPPVTGYVAAGGSLGLEAALLFGILFFWQLPHSLAIARLYRDDYAAADIRMLPTVDATGSATGRHAVLNSLSLLAVGMLPTVTGMSGWAPFVVAAALGAWMLWRCVRLALQDSTAAARRLLIASYVYIPLVMVTLAIDRLLV
jgi:protoheme IX farnesyltransferase